MKILDFVLTAFCGAVITLLVQFAANRLVALREMNSGEFAGNWYAVLASAGGKGERRETMRVRQRGNVLNVHIRRYYPMTESGKTWKMVAYIHGNILIGVFYTNIPRKDPSSYGAILLHRDYSVKDSMVWRGFYVRPDANTLREVMSFEADRFPMLWQQVKPEVMHYGLPVQQHWSAEGIPAQAADGEDRQSSAES